MLDNLPSLPHDPRLVAILFRRGQLTRARELRGYTKTVLAERIGKTPSAVTQFESGAARPDGETVARLALALAVPTHFFARDALGGALDLSTCHFRSLRSVTQNRRRQALRIGELCHELSTILQSEGAQLPSDQISPLKRPVRTGLDIERLATDVRRAWGLGLGPIHQVIPLLESKGLRGLPLTDACAEVDAFSTWVDGEPLAMLALKKPPSRVHFDAAHELGHLLMHEDVTPGSPILESQADDFASAFLLPQTTYLQECPSRWGLPIFQALKQRWHVSIQALVVRAYRLEKLSVSSYRRAFVTLGHLNYRFREPDEWPLDRPTVLRQALELLSEEIPLSRLAKAVALNEAQLRQILRPILEDAVEPDTSASLGPGSPGGT